MRRCMGCIKEYEDGITVCPYCGYTSGTPAREAYHLPPETILNGRYLVGRVIGFGGFGTTYIAWDLMLEKKVAIKEYMPSDFATRAPGETQLSVYDGELGEQFEAGLKSFIDESRRLAKFNHEDGIVHIFDSFLENGTAYIVMEYLEGKTLKELLKERGGKIPYDEAVRYILPILKSLDAVHQTGIIHRDIAPDNIFLTNNGKVKLIDFGASRYATTLHSKSLSVILKQGYAPEEQYRSHGEQGPWSDVYAVCATLYRAITGIVPEDALERCANDKLVPPSKMGINLPNGIENAILNGLNIKAENRIQSANELAQALSGEIEVQRIKEERKKDDVGKWSKRQIVVAALSGVAIIAVVIMAVLGVFNLNKSLDTTLYTTVPDYIGMTLDEAKDNWNEYCKSEGIENVSISVSNGVASDQINGYEVNQIYAIMPETGSWFKKVSQEEKFIYVTIVLASVQDMINENQGKESWVMQDITNYSQTDAQRILESMAGVSFTFEVVSSEKSAGTVVRTEPAAGTQVSKGDSIVVYISDGSHMNVVETVDEEVVKQEEAANNGGNFFDDLFDNLRPGNDGNKNEETTTKEEQGNSDSTTQSVESSTNPTKPQKYTLTVAKGSGVSAVAGMGKYEPGTNVTITASVNSGYEFSGWTSSNTSLVSNSSNASYTFRMPAADITLTANTKKKAKAVWEYNFYGIKCTVYDDGLLLITGSGTLPNGDEELGGPWGPSQITGQDIPVHITKIIISDGITSIGSYLFAYCQFVTEIVIPDSVNYIGQGAFYRCRKLEHITIPSSVKSINDNTFKECKSLERVDLPEGLVEIKADAFSYCDNLSSINLPNGLTDIGMFAFSNCYNLKSINIPNSVESIEWGAFYGCKSIKNITIPSTVIYMEEQIFTGWTADQTIYIQGISNKPSRWDEAWLVGCNAKIVWNA